MSNFPSSLSQQRLLHAPTSIQDRALSFVGHSFFLHKMAFSSHPHQRKHSVGSRGVQLKWKENIIRTITGPLRAISRPLLTPAPPARLQCSPECRRQCSTASFTRKDGGAVPHCGGHALTRLWLHAVLQRSVEGYRGGPDCKAELKCHSNTGLLPNRDL